MFINEQGGYTTLAVAVSLLLSISLTLSLATGAWIQNRSADIQSVADSAALAGANVVGSYMTLATVVDACMLTMGLVGVFTMGAGLVLSAIPGMASAGATTVEAGSKILESRQSFATSASKGLQKLEETLPLMIVARSAAVIGENSTDSASYYGCALPYPLESKSDFSSLESVIDTDEIGERAEEIQEASDNVKEYQDEVNEAKKRGWLADCGSKSYCMYERANTLASLSSAKNAYYSLNSWTFGAALVRARAYYAQRLAQEAPLNASAKELTNSECRRFFFSYALKELSHASYKENADGTVSISFPKFPSNTAEMKQTWLYATAHWSCTQDAGKRTIHASLSCPAASKSSPSGMASLAELDSGSVAYCDTCQLGLVDMGSVGSASTNIENGFEHWWQEVVEASQDYAQAANNLANAQKELKKASQQGASAFDEALKLLKVARPAICPPGAYGCVAAVWRAGELTSPEQFNSAFTQEARVGSGAAVSAAVLAPDNNTDANDVLTRFSEALAYDLGKADVGVLGTLGSLWSSVLGAYQSGYEGVSGAATKMLDKIEGIPGGSVASWLCEKIKSFTKEAGFEPADLRLRKPVLTNSQNVFEAGGNTVALTAREYITLLGQSSGLGDFASAIGQKLANKLEGETFTLAEVSIPGTDISIPLTVDVGELMGQVLS